MESSIRLGTKFQEVLMPIPDTYTPILKSKGAKHELQDGSMEFDLVARKWSWRIAWRWLTLTERDTILWRVEYPSLSLVDFDESQYDVEMIEPLNVDFTKSTNPIRYHISLSLEER